MQIELFHATPPALDAGFRHARRLALGDGAWVEHVPGWLAGHRALFDGLVAEVAWRHERRPMYDRVVDVPRLLGRPDGPHPVLDEASARLSERYGRRLDRITLALYRDGRDSVAWHGDAMGALRRDTVVAVLGLGSPRRFLLRPRGGRTQHRFLLGEGTLVVMGGTCQDTWEHAVPKVAHAEPRIAVMFREATPTPAHAR